MEEETIVERLEKEIEITHPQALEIQLKLYDILLPILCSIIIIVNLLIVLSSGLLLHKRQQPRSTYIFLGNVALSDLLIGMTFLPAQYYPPELRNDLICCITIGMNVCSALVSVFSVGLIGIDRYLFILYGLHYQRYITSQRARVMVLGTWLVGGVIAFLPAFGLRNPTDNGKLCWFVVLVPPKLVLFTTSVGLIPLVVIVVLYSIILKHALVRISFLHRASVQNQGAQVGDLRLNRGGLSSSKTSVGPIHAPSVICLQEAREIPTQTKRSIFKCCRRTNKSKINLPVYSANKWKAIKIVLLTTGAFFITWFPYFIASMLHAMCSPYSDPDYCDGLRVALASPLTLLGLCNSLLNPIIYAWWHNGFRESVKKIFKGLISQRSQTEEKNIVQRSSQASNSTGIESQQQKLSQGTNTNVEESPLKSNDNQNLNENVNSNELEL